MKRQFFNYILLLILLCSVGLNANAQSMRAEAKLQDYTLKIGEQTKLFLVVNKAVNEQVNFPVLADTVIGKVQIVSANKPDTLIDQNDKSRVTITHSYVITCFDAGTYTIPPFAFGTSGGVIKTNELSLVIQTVKVDTTKAIYDIKQPLVVTYGFFDWLKDNWILVLSGLIVLGIIGWAIYYFRKQKGLPIIHVAKPSEPIHTTALNKLTALQDKKLWQQQHIKQYHSELTDIIREYLEKRYYIKTYEKTTDEILAALKHRDITDEYTSLLKQLLSLADLVKFAKEKPLPAENERSIEDAITFVLKTKESEKPVSTTDGGSANEPV